MAIPGRRWSPGSPCASGTWGWAPRWTAGWPAGLENGALGERLLQRFAQPLQGLEADRLELKAMLHAELPLGRQQQTFLLQLLGAVEHAPGGEYLAQLARRELQVLIPLNGMLDNLVRNSHKLDLES
ncbi:type III export protein PscH [Pseudomonas aeruginosa VRFPA03]|nr:type III export protein PscH [Pseudomonas aeruginosa VRFPA03]